MTVFEYDGRLLIVDCGVLFPEDHHPGVDLILPDFEPIRDRLDDGRGAGADPRPRGPHRRDAVPAARARRHPAGRLAAHPGAARLQAARAPAQGDRAARRHRGRPDRASGRSTWSSSRSTTRSPTRSRSRSAPAPARCCTPATSRWTSCRSTAGSPTCARSPGSARRASTCSWSTPPTPRCPGFTTSEEDIAPGARPGLPPASEQRIIVACFASHVHRVQQVMDAAVAHGRKVAYVGRSMVRNMGIARDLGYLTVPPDTLVDAKELARLPARADGADLDRLAGRAAVGAVPDRAAQPQLRAHRGGRHRRARLAR